MRLLLCLILLLLLPAQAIARPVSYPGGWTVMQMNDMDANTLHVHYSPTARYSIGYLGEYWREDNWQFHGLQLNYLAKRWNAPSSQANLYLKSALGLAYSDEGAFDGKTEEAGFLGISADWEDRRLFTMYENRLTHAGEIDRFFSQKARVGVAPYLGDYGDLHTWLMVQVDHRPEAEDEFTVTPMVRFFKGVNLVELGASHRGDVLVNWVVRF